MDKPGINEGVIEYICEGGHGSEAIVNVELRTKFPGIGGTIITQEGVVTASRADFSPAPGQGHEMFLRHMVIKKLEDFFHRTHVYNFAHIPRPLGSISAEGDKPIEAYLYEWAFGREGFAWEIPNGSGGRTSVKLNDWDAFVDNFGAAGISLSSDVTDPDNGRISKNLIHQLPWNSYDDGGLSSIWKRIDFGARSAPIDYEKLSRFLRDSQKPLEETLKRRRYRMIALAAKYLNLATKSSMKSSELGALERLVGEYRLSSLRHHTSRGGSDLTEHAYFGEVNPALAR